MKATSQSIVALLAALTAIPAAAQATSEEAGSNAVFSTGSDTLGRNHQRLSDVLCIEDDQAARYRAWH
jgi:hypothetical protein